jgi:hypothetical protein
MTPLPPVANTLKCQLGWYIDNNDRVENVLHFTYTGGTPSAGNCAGFAADFQASQITNLKPYTHTVNGIETCTVTDIGSTTGAQGTGGTVTGGSMTGSYLPAQTAMVVNHHISQRYRGGKPRSYLPLGNQASLLTPGQWTSSFVTNISTAWATFMTTCLAATVGGITLTNFVAVSYIHAGSVRGTPVTYPIINTTARQTVGSQRRRIKGA